MYWLDVRGGLPIHPDRMASRCHADALARRLCTACNHSLHRQFNAGSVHYKHLVTAEICLAPLVSGQPTHGLVDRVASRSHGHVGCRDRGSNRGCLHMVRSSPRELPFGIPVDESSSFLRANSGSHRAWLEAIRTDTPKDTILVLPDSPIPVSTQPTRSLVAAQPRGIFRAGHGMDQEIALVQIEGSVIAISRTF